MTYVMNGNPHEREKMNRAKAFTVSAAVVTFLAGGIAFADDFDMDKAKQVFETKCSKCHATERPASKTKTKEGWTATVKRMQSKNPAWIGDEEAETIIKYLSKAHGQ